MPRHCSEPQQLSHHDSPVLALCARFTHERATTPQNSCGRCTARLHTSNVQMPRRSKHRAEPQHDLKFRVRSCVVACRRCHNPRRRAAWSFGSPPWLFGLKAAHKVFMPTVINILRHEHAQALLSRTRIRSKLTLPAGEKSRFSTKKRFSFHPCRRVTYIISHVLT